MYHKKFSRLVRQGFLTEGELLDAIAESSAAGKYPEDILLSLSIPKYELLFCLTEYYNCPFTEYDEEIIVSPKILKIMDFEMMKKDLWIPLYVDDMQAEVIAYNPDASLAEEIKASLNVETVSFLVALPADVIHIIENNYDLNPNFGVPGGRTPLAWCRIFYGERRSMLASYRTSLAKGRTGLAFIRTGISFMTIAIILFRLFGIGYLTLLETALLIIGLVITIDGLRWYLPARRTGGKIPDCTSTEPMEIGSILEIHNPGNNPCFTRSGPAEGAAELRSDWSNLSPVMRRRFLASDRTDLAEERTTLACHRTLMARGRNGLAFSRTGVAFAALGIVLIRHFRASGWTGFDVGLILIGTLMVMEGFYWYLPGRRSGIVCVDSLKTAEQKSTIWEMIFPPGHQRTFYKDIHSYPPPVKSSHARGIWGTAGLALERTMLADRRNIMARLRTIMARSRTGLAFIRTGISFAAIGFGLLAYYGTHVMSWTIINVILIITGLLLISDGLYWYLPAEKIRKQYPYCLADLEIPIPDYGKPVQLWKKITFGDENIN